MAGRQSTGAAASAVSDIVLDSRKRRLDQEDEERKFRQRLQELGIKAGIETGQITPKFQGGQLQGFQQTNLQPMTSQGLESQLGIGASVPGQSPFPQGSQTPQAGGQLRDAQGQFTTKITQEFDQLGRVKGFKVDRSEVKPDKLSPQEQLFADIRQAQSAIPAAQQGVQSQLQTLQSSPPMRFGVSEQAMTARPEAMQRVSDIARQPLVQAQGQLGQLLSQTEQLGNAGLIKTSQPTGTQAFRQDLQDAITAVSDRKISKREAINRLLREYPDKASTINKLEQDLF